MGSCAGDPLLKAWLTWLRNGFLLRLFAVPCALLALHLEIYGSSPATTSLILHRLSQRLRLSNFALCLLSKDISKEHGSSVNAVFFVGGPKLLESAPSQLDSKPKSKSLARKRSETLHKDPAPSTLGCASSTPQRPLPLQRSSISSISSISSAATLVPSPDAPPRPRTIVREAPATSDQSGILSPTVQQHRRQALLRLETASTTNTFFDSSPLLATLEEEPCSSALSDDASTPLQHPAHYHQPAPSEPASDASTFTYFNRPESSHEDWATTTVSGDVSPVLDFERPSFDTSYPSPEHAELHKGQALLTLFEHILYLQRTAPSVTAPANTALAHPCSEPAALSKEPTPPTLSEERHIAPQLPAAPDTASTASTPTLPSTGFDSLRKDRDPAPTPVPAAPSSSPPPTSPLIETEPSDIEPLTPLGSVPPTLQRPVWERPVLLPLQRQALSDILALSSPSTISRPSPQALTTRRTPASSTRSRGSLLPWEQFAEPEASSPASSPSPLSSVPVTEPTDPAAAPSPITAEPSEDPSLAPVAVPSSPPSSPQPSPTIQIEQPTPKPQRPVWERPVLLPLQRRALSDILATSTQSRPSPQPVTPRKVLGPSTSGGSVLPWEQFSTPEVSSPTSTLSHSSPDLETLSGDATPTPRHRLSLQRSAASEVMSHSSSPRPSMSSHSRSMSHAEVRSQGKRLSLQFPIQPASSNNSPGYSPRTRPSPRSRPQSWVAVPSPPVLSSDANDSTAEHNVLAVLAAQERYVLELKEELAKAEEDLKKVKKHWATHQSIKQRNEMRKVTQLQPLSNNLIDIRPDHEDQDGSTTWMQKEMERRKALMNGSKVPQRKVFSGSRHLRTLSLLSPNKTHSPSFPQPDDIRGSMDDLDPRPQTLMRTATAPEFAQMDNTVKDDRFEIGGLSNIQREALLRTGKQMASDFKEGLLTFFEDIKQATVGDEDEDSEPGGITRKLPAARPVLTRGSSSKKSTSQQPGNIADDFWKEHGLSEPRPAPSARRTHDLKNTQTPKKPVKEEEFDAWDSWDTPSAEKATLESDTDEPSSPVSGQASSRTSTRYHSKRHDSKASTLTASSSDAPPRDSKRNSIPWPDIAKLSPNNLKRTASHLMKEWEKNLTPPPESRDSAHGNGDYIGRSASPVGFP